MSNNRPDIPDISCVIPAPIDPGYYTENQSITNIARKDRFILVLDVPCAIKRLLENNNSCKGLDLNKLTFNIWGFVVPEQQINKNDVGYGGQWLKVSNHSRPALPSINVNFTIDNRFINYYILNKWIELMNDAESSQFDANRLNPNSKGHIDEYTTTFTVYAEDEYEGKPVVKWDYYGAFPTLLGSIDSTSRDGGELESSVTFEVNYIKMELM